MGEKGVETASQPDKAEIEAKIAEKQALIAELETLAAQRPDLVALTHDDDLSTEDHRLWQKIKFLPVARQILAQLESKLI